MRKISLLIALIIPFALHAQSVITTIIGNGTSGNSGDGGPATAAQLNGPGGIAFDAAGNMYISDFFSNVIRKMSTTGVMSTYAGSGTVGFSGDGGPATAARFNGPAKMTFDGSGNLYVADHYNNRIRKISTTGVITTVAGTGALGFSGDGVAATASNVARPAGVKFHPSGDMYILDYNGCRIRRVTPAGIIYTVAGNSLPGSTGDGGPATAAQVHYPFGMDIDNAGNVYIAEADGEKVRYIDAAGIIHTLAGTGTNGFSGDGGPATAAMLSNPAGVTLDGTGGVYIADQFNCRIRKVNSGIISTFAGTTCGYSGDGGSPLAAAISRTNEIAFDPSGNMIITDNDNHVVRKIVVCGNYISAQPMNDTTLADDTATYSVTSSVTGAVHQWQENSGSGFVNLTDIPPYSGTHTATLTISPASVSLNGAKYRCVVSSESSPCVDTSADGLLVILPTTGVYATATRTISIFPNPAKESIRIVSEHTEEGNVLLTDALGRKVAEQELLPGGTTLDIAMFPPGVYFVKVSIAGENTITRLVKE